MSLRRGRTLASFREGWNTGLGEKAVGRDREMNIARGMNVGVSAGRSADRPDCAISRQGAMERPNPGPALNRLFPTQRLLQIILVPGAFLARR